MGEGRGRQDGRAGRALRATEHFKTCVLQGVGMKKRGVGMGAGPGAYPYSGTRSWMRMSWTNATRAMTPYAAAKIWNARSCAGFGTARTVRMGRTMRARERGPRKARRDRETNLVVGVVPPPVGAVAVGEERAARRAPGEGRDTR